MTQTQEDSWSVARENWARFYREIFGIQASFKNVPISSMLTDRTPRIPLIVPSEVCLYFKNEPLEGIYQLARKHFGAGKYTDGSLDELVNVSDRDVGLGTYAVLTLNRIEARHPVDMEVITGEWSTATIRGQTLFERLLHELYFFWKSGKKHHLDVQGGTVCLGSMDLYGKVPYVRWDNEKGRLIIGACKHRLPSDNFYPRQVWT